MKVLELDEGALDPGPIEGFGGEGDLSKVLAIWPLPGGATAWVSTLRAMLEKVSADQPTVAEAVTWLMSSYEKVTKEKAARGYWLVPRQMRLLETSGERLLLSDLGAEYLDVGSNQWLLQRLKDSFVGIEELLQRLIQGPATNEQLLEYLRNQAHVTWETDAQLRFRLGWLENVGAVEKHGNQWVRSNSSEK